MKRHKWLIVGGLFLVVVSGIISISKPLLNFLPAREVRVSHSAAYVPLLKDHLFIQEITLNHRYLNRIDLLIGNIPNAAPTLNIFLLLDKDHRIIYSKRFSSTEIDGPTYYPFEFRNNMDIGNGEKVYACIYSPDSDPQNFLMLLRNPEANLGPLRDVPILNNDIPLTLEQQPSSLILPGSMGVKIYETNTLSFSWLQVFLYILALLVSLFLVFQKRITPLVLKVKILPERAFLGISLLLGLAFAFITPPFQVADESAHLCRSWQVSEFNLLKYSEKVPESLIQLSAISNRMNFMAHEKTGIEELLSLTEIELNETKQVAMETPNYVLPYLPQAVGMSVGSWFGTSLLGQFYLARVLNLLASIFILFMAIRITPIMKWLFFLLALLPMTLYQVASLSYDAMTISLSFLLSAMIFKLAFGKTGKVTIHNLWPLFLVAGLLALCKPPYYIIALAFLIIPVSKLGSRKRFFLTFLGLAATILVCSQIWSVSREILRPKEQISAIEPIRDSRFAITDLVSRIPDPEFIFIPTAYNLYPTSYNVFPTAFSLQPTAYNTDSQQRFILQNPLRYLGILGQTLETSGHLYLISFIGLFGWVDTPLPWFLIILYYFMLILISATSPSPGITVNWKDKSILLAIFLLGFVLIETAMYLCCNTVGSDQIMAVQGRYFVAFGPLIFILFYNNRIIQLIGGASSRSIEKTGKHKRNKKRDLSVQEAESRLVYASYLPWFVILFGIGGLLYSLYVILTRFYIITL